MRDGYIPLADLLFSLFLRNAISFLDLAHQKIPFSIDDLQIIVCQLSPFFFHRALELIPFTAYLVPVHEKTPPLLPLRLLPLRQKKWKRASGSSGSSAKEYLYQRGRPGYKQSKSVAPLGLGHVQAKVKGLVARSDDGLRGTLSSSACEHRVALIRGSPKVIVPAVAPEALSGFHWFFGWLASLLTPPAIVSRTVQLLRSLVMAGKNTAAFGIYRTQADVEYAVDLLRTEGFRNTDISVLFPENKGTKDFAVEKNTKAPEGTATGVTTGAVVGGTLGWLAGIGALAIPGVGPLIAAGPIVHENFLKLKLGSSTLFRREVRLAANINRVETTFQGVIGQFVRRGGA
jgi:hypothetical protein